ncbi:hypothetical protein CH75_04985 [Dyella jiangningensis]|nr:hypothetical protein CH75_04985 [Dyella jiangningensis]
MGGQCSGNDVRGWVGPAQGGPNPVGLAISNTGTGNVIGNNVDLVMSGQLNSNIFFGSDDKGHNTIRVNAYQTSGSRYTGTPHASDVIELNLFGSTTPSLTNGRPVAWVSFDGTVATPTIKSSFNVLSVTKASTGHYTINFVGTITGGTATVVASSDALHVAGAPYANNTTSQDIVCNNLSGVAADAMVHVSIYSI